jgi:hypothetical protein
MFCSYPRQGDDTSWTPAVNAAELAAVLAHAAVDVCALLALMVLYARRHEGRELMMVYVCFNVGLFAALVAITAGHFPAGVGFGLFGVLSIIRLRSQPFTTAQIGYFFLVLVLALADGLSGRGLLLSAGLSAALLVTVYLADHPAMHPTVHSTRVVLDRAYGDSEELRAAVARRVEGTVVDLRITEVDEVRDLTRVAVRYRRLDGAPVGDFAADLDEPAESPEPERAR